MVVGMVMMFWIIVSLVGLNAFFRMAAIFWMNMHNLFLLMVTTTFWVNMHLFFYFVMAARFWMNVSVFGFFSFIIFVITLFNFFVQLILTVWFWFSSQLWVIFMILLNKRNFLLCCIYSIRDLVEVVLFNNLNRLFRFTLFLLSFGMAVRTTAISMRVSVGMLMEKHQSNDIDTKAEHRN